jgi:hypothetical protein
MFPVLLNIMLINFAPDIWHDTKSSVANSWTSIFISSLISSPICSQKIGGVSGDVET